jgi:hypothetical protein
MVDGSVSILFFTFHVRAYFQRPESVLLGNHQHWCLAQMVRWSGRWRLFLIIKSGSCLKFVAMRVRRLLLLLSGSHTAWLGGVVGLLNMTLGNPLIIWLMRPKLWLLIAVSVYWIHLI